MNNKTSTVTLALSTGPCHVSQDVQEHYKHLCKGLPDHKTWQPIVSCIITPLTLWNTDIYFIQLQQIFWKFSPENKSSSFVSQHACFMNDSILIYAKVFQLLAGSHETVTFPWNISRVFRSQMLTH